jgi:uncharacterized protein (TIGR03435 family)
MNIRTLALFLTPITLLGQSGPRFEVASVKPSTPASIRMSEGGPGSKDPTHYRFASATLHDFIAIAWNLHRFQISSKLPIENDRYDIIVNVPAGATRNDFRLMMRTLLTERFEFKYHLETKDFPGYELTVSKSGLKMKESDPAAPPPHRDGFPDLRPGPGFTTNSSNSGDYRLVRMRAQQQTVASLADHLTTLQSQEEPVVDKTGLTGIYDFLLEFTMDSSSARPGASEPAAAPSLFTAVQKELGLQLIAKKLPFDVVVVESFKRVPSEN